MEVSTAPAPQPAPASAPMPEVSLVLPAFNEAGNLEEAVAQAVPPLESITRAWEIVVVNDASTDGTGALADRLAAAHPGRVRPIHHETNKGLGGAIRSGFAAARGRVVIYTDADLPFDMRALADAYRHFEASGADVLAGYREGRDDGLRRRLYSSVYNGLIRLALGIPVRDVNFALKMVRRDVLQRLALESDGSFIDAELLARARRAGFRFTEYGVRYTPRTRGTSTLSRPSVILRILADLVRFRMRTFRLRPGRRVEPRP
ncbi:MAG TPA: glycosyltransferase family 2 protein [Rubricoccaceae bacterium]|nr:glycosyltransferase family 2 protein [Rubricoccaceae bacterium]